MKDQRIKLDDEKNGRKNGRTINRMKGQRKETE
jgi:hypothetical protein